MECFFSAEILDDLAKITQLINGRAGHKPKSIWLLVQLSLHHLEIFLNLFCMSSEPLDEAQRNEVISHSLREQARESTIFLPLNGSEPWSRQAFQPTRKIQLESWFVSHRICNYGHQVLAPNMFQTLIKNIVVYDQEAHEKTLNIMIC